MFRKGVSRKFSLAVNICLPIMVLTFIFLGIMFMFYSRKAACIGEFPFSFVHSEIDTRQDYSGLYVFARECFWKAIVYFSFSLYFCILWVGKIFQMKRDKRILKYIDKISE